MVWVLFHHGWEKIFEFYISWMSSNAHSNIIFTLEFGHEKFTLLSQPPLCFSAKIFQPPAPLKRRAQTMHPSSASSVWPIKTQPYMLKITHTHQQPPLHLHAYAQPPTRYITNPHLISLTHQDLPTFANIHPNLSTYRPALKRTTIH